MKKTILWGTILCLGAWLVACQSNKSPERDFSAAKERFTTNCSGCHGAQMEAFTDRKWKHGNAPDSLFKTIKYGLSDLGMPTFEAAFTDEEINDLVAYIRTGIENTGQYEFEEETVRSDTFPATVDFDLKLDTIYSGGEVPWGMVFLPNGDLLVTEVKGELLRINAKQEKTKIKGVPSTQQFGQGGLMDIELHPDFDANQILYISYSKIKIEGSDTLATTAIARYKYAGDSLTDGKDLIVATPYSKKPYHFGSRIEFDAAGYLFFSVGDRGSRDVNPQNLDNHCGKIHRILDDGSIPENNPFVGDSTAVPSIYSYGHRNPQGIAFNPQDGLLWEHEHGPRGGDELNIIQASLNYGWPEVSYGINYDGTIFTSDTTRQGMQSPVHYWVPSIAPCGMDFVDSDLYPGWEGQLLTASLRFKYLNLCKIEGKKVVEEERLLHNIGRIRNVKVAPDGYIYVAIEQPGYIFKLLPIKKS
ncbi:MULTISPECIES: PQQ-dependent sugar dehydrogenase [Reichenbachiella]|uniref:Glucose/arabinose dehydrogenase, beta-propeller fold n=1 Tax=Reichenbachiella agariperforans TaxID=156994 RepID=A0A1M6W9N3_REIAG|nr:MULTISPECIES: PQQ-dependent sugar dehydrogenase [Reichenbachiella]RJE70340.1 hypothetical protein BGP76_09570 [Reichenbachiella sp. MSK19-1]SHK90407.1 Glucose/arabinose dehydrogenase, beta-propeller fold [Reichenbachiella agariperforans]